MAFEIPNLTLLRQFVVTAEEGGMTRAAKRLRISQPALSKNISKLEDLLQTPLFDRHARGIVLTKAGELFLERAQVIGLEYQHALEEIRNVVSEHATVVRIGSGPIWTSTVLARVAGKFHQQFPGHRLQVQTGSIEELTEALRLGRIDVLAGPILNATRLPGFTQRRLAKSDMIVLAGTSHPLVADGKKVSPQDVSRHPFVSFAPSREVISDLTQFLRTHGAAPPQIVLETSSLYACVEMVRSGQYLLYETRMLCQNPIGQGLREVRVTGYHAPYDIGMMHREGLDRIPRFRSLLRIMAESLGATMQS